jgi:signal peptidase II
MGESVRILPFFNIVRVENSGVTFGLLNGALPSYVLTLTSLLIIVFLCTWIKSNQYYLFPGSLVIGGAIGNLVDRIIYGAVIDFLDFHLLTYHWPAFNVADSAIVVGGTTMFFMSYRKESK